MDSMTASYQPNRFESRFAAVFFMLCLGFSLWGVQVGWQNKHLPGVEFRQAQTALSIYWIDAENDFSLAYPTPVLGKPWSIPMEFPLYQWTAVVVSKVTDWSITKAGRAVSIGCFYLCLPAIFLLLRRWTVHPNRRWWILSVIVTCPLYIFYTRGIFIETMALMFSLWFWVAFERGVAKKSMKWLACAAVMGTGAGLVKVTTFMLYLLPSGIWALHRLWIAPREEFWREFKWMALAVVVPFTATVWWVHTADMIKGLNPLAEFLNSGNLRGFNFGTLAMRLDSAVWLKQARIILGELTWLPAVGLAVVAAILARGNNLRAILGCLAGFVSVLVIFPLLYALHDYYFMANTVLLLLAMGLALTGWLNSGRWRVMAMAFAVAVPLGQCWGYLQHYYAIQHTKAPDGNGLTEALRSLTKPDEVIVILGEDWNSMTAYYSRRRALMFRNGVARDPEAVVSALSRLEGEKLGALIIVGEQDGEEWLIDRAAAFGLMEAPLCVWREARVFLPKDRLIESMDCVLNNYFHDVALASDFKVPRDHLGGKWFRMAPLKKWERHAFHAMNPQPVRFFSTFGPALDESGGQTRFGAHPVTRLIFELPAGKHTLNTTLQLPDGAYAADLEPGAKTDGIEVVLYALGPNGEQVQLARRLFDPVNNPGDRGNQRPLQMEFTLIHPGEVELFFGPGAAGRDTRDWIEMGPLTIEGAN